MDKTKILEQARRIQSGIAHNRQVSIPEAVEFLRMYSGVGSSFYKSISELNVGDYWHDGTAKTAAGIFSGFINFLENDLQGGVSLTRKVQIETVSDFLEQAEVLLETKDIHPAVPIAIIGAALEEFLRNLVEENGLLLPISNKKSIDVYLQALCDKEILDKQDRKDITSWAGLRNSAAHGKWEEVNDKTRALIMLEGVNLFMRKNGSKN